MQICRTICPHPIQSTFSKDRVETTKCFVLGENRTEDDNLSENHHNERHSNQHDTESKVDVAAENLSPENYVILKSGTDR